MLQSRIFPENFLHQASRSALGFCRRIQSLKIANVLEPSHQLINALVQCVEDGRVRYIEWSRFASRTQEVNNVKEDGPEDLAADGTGAIKAVNKKPTSVATLTTELDIHNALRRRGMAYENSSGNELPDA